MTNRPRPFVLIILDGWGVSSDLEGNAIAAANTPNFDYLRSEFPYTTLGAAGEDVGLPEGQQGDSEVGHLNLGAGRVVSQDYTRVNNAIRDGSLFKNKVLIKAMDHVKKNGSVLHIMGLLSDGGVHSHIKHHIALIEMARSMGVKDVYSHVFLDGRDVPPRSALQYAEWLESVTGKDGRGRIKTISGRYYAMDRDRRWDRVKLAYEAVAQGIGRKASTPREAILNSYAEDVDDEFLVPCVITGPDDPPVQIKNEDTVIFFNFRPDRARELTRSLVEKEFKEFDRGKNPPLPYFVSMTEYDPGYPVHIAFPPKMIVNVLAEVLSAHGLRQLHIAETEKYAHVTFFFNGGVEEPKAGEDRCLIPSPKVRTYDLQPEMSALGVVEEAVKGIDEDIYDVIIINFANCDMVGHTGAFDAAVAAVEAVDKCLGMAWGAVLEKDGAAFITADHGNAEVIIEAGEIVTCHTCNRVPFISAMENSPPLREGGNLGDVAPTILEALGIDKPSEMTGRSLFAGSK